MADGISLAEQETIVNFYRTDEPFEKCKMCNAFIYKESNHD